MQLFDVLNQNWFDLTKAVLHMNQQQLMTSAPSDLSSACCYFASGHDSISLNKINHIAQSHVVMGAFLSPVLPTPTHPEAATLGWQGFADLAIDSDVPIFALGGLSMKDLATVQAHGGYGVAGMRLIDNLWLTTDKIADTKVFFGYNDSQITWLYGFIAVFNRI